MKPSKLKSIELNEGIFDGEELELFSKKRKASIIFARNGEGKSTVARSLNQASDNIILYDYSGNTHQGEEIENSYVFNEDFIRENIYLKENGIKSLLIMGDNVKLEKDIEKVEFEKKELNNEIHTLEDKQNKITEEISKLDGQIKSVLKSHWAARGKDIKKRGRNLSVSEKNIRMIESIPLTFSLEKISKEYDKTYRRYENEEFLDEKIEPIRLDFSETELKNVISTRITLLNNGDYDEKIKYIDSLEESQSFFNSDINVCPKCLQNIGDEYKRKILQLIEQRLENDKLRQKKIDLQRIDSKITALMAHLKKVSNILENSRSLDTSEDVQLKVKKLLQDCTNLASLVSKNIENPYLVDQGKSFDLEGKVESLNKSIEDFLHEQKEYNARLISEEKMKELNNHFARAEINDYLNKKEESVKEEKSIKIDLSNKKDRLSELNKKLTDLKARKANRKIGLQEINNDLSYIFYSKDRLRVKWDGKDYVIFSRGNYVSPKDISIGERNIIALVYFFNSLKNKRNAKNYSNNEFLIVLDDPISSFDIGNRVGILSYIKAKLREISRGNQESKFIILTHDMNIAQDLVNILNSILINSRCNSMKLENKKLTSISFNNNNYKQHLKNIYDFAFNANNNRNLENSIGNIMRKCLEAFCTFSYGKGIDDVLDNEIIMKPLELKEKRYLENSVFRLVNNYESHEENLIKNEKVDLSDIYSYEEKRKLSRDLLALMYRLNETHIRLYLEDENDAIENIKGYLENHVGY